MELRYKSGILRDKFTCLFFIMLYRLLIVSLFFVGAGCATTPPTDNPSTTAAPAQEKPVETEDTGSTAQILPATNTPVIGGTARDPLGEGEECIINGDCAEEGFACIDGECVQPRI